MKRTNGSFVPVGFSRIRTERLKNWSEKCEGPGGGDRWVKEPEWEMWRTGWGDRQVKESEWEMRKTGRGGLDGLKNRNGKWEGSGAGGRRNKKSEWEMRRTRARGGTNGCLKRKVFLKNQKHQPNIVEITHLCIMHGVHTSVIIISNGGLTHQLTRPHTM